MVKIVILLFIVKVNAQILYGFVDRIYRVMYHYVRPGLTVVKENVFQ